MTLEQATLKRLRAICRPLPEVLETSTFGHPTFQAGAKRTFVVLDDHERKDELCLVFKASLGEQERLLDQRGFLPCKYGARHGWTSLVIGPGMDWKQVGSLILDSYRLVAKRRSVEALDERAAKSKRPAARAVVRRK